MPRKKGRVVDHMDRNGLNNHRGNLRYCSKGENAQGSRRPRRYSEYVGVTFAKARKKWVARITKDHEQHHLGYFDLQRLAALTYDIAAERLYGTEAKKNFRNFVARDLARRWILPSKGRIFSALVTKRTNGEYRELVGKLVPKALVAKMKFDPYTRNLMPIFDLSRENYRLLNVDGLALLTIGGETWRML